MLHSMTGFAARRGQGEGALAGYSWTWDLRSVNGKGLELRLRLPDWIEGLETAVRAVLGRTLHRGNVSVTLKLMREGGADAVQINHGALRSVLAGLATVTATAEGLGLPLAQASAAEVLAMRGILETASDETDTAPLRDALMADFTPLLTEFTAMRAAEGRALHGVLSGQIDRIEALTVDAARAAAARQDKAAQTLREALARVLDNAEGADPARVAQELALIAVKSDVTEELDRLTAHVAAARALLAEPGPVGRKFDFLMQEFNREANTLCSKAQSINLTRIGLDLKTVIDQMREQVQNVE